MLRMLETTCENILSTGPTTLSPNTNSSALALLRAQRVRDMQGQGSSPRHTNNQRGERPDWSQYNDRNKRPPADVRKPLGGTDEWH